MRRESAGPTPRATLELVSDDILELSVAWQRHVAPTTELLDRLLARHREKHRRYHTVRHVAWVIRHIDALAADGCDLVDHGAVVAAACYHDAVYEPASPANERASARLAARDLRTLGWVDARIERVVQMIEGTKDHHQPADTDTAVLFDADLAILGADPAAYGDYSTQVRAEYRHVDDIDWATGRAAVLQSLLDRPSIFATEQGRARWDERARGNLTAELAELAAR